MKPILDAYFIEDVRENLTPSLQNEIIQFWVGEGVLPEAVAQERVHQVIQVLRQNESKAIIGLVSGQLKYIDAMKMHFYSCRGFVKEAYRSKGLFIKTFRDSYYLLNQDYVSGKNTQASGVFVNIENPLLKNHNQAIWWGGDKGEVPYFFMGYSAQGHHIRIAYFTGVTV